jgi:hypothetical protein
VTEGVTTTTRRRRRGGERGEGGRRGERGDVTLRRRGSLTEEDWKESFSSFAPREWSFTVFLLKERQLISHHLSSKRDRSIHSTSLSPHPSTHTTAAQHHHDLTIADASLIATERSRQPLSSSMSQQVICSSVKSSTQSDRLSATLSTAPLLPPHDSTPPYIRSE